jgi:hypothetical protein
MNIIKNLSVFDATPYEIIMEKKKDEREGRAETTVETLTEQRDRTKYGSLPISTEGQYQSFPPSQ